MEGDGRAGSLQMACGKKSRGEMHIRRNQTLIYKDQCTVLVFAWRLKTWTYSLELVDEFSRANESGGVSYAIRMRGEKKEYAVNAR